MVQNGYKRMLKCNNDEENKLWNQTYKELNSEKNILINKLSDISKADDEFYKQSESILKFCKNASKFFLNATPSEKRTVCEIIGSNFKANGQNIDITLYPLFYDIIELNRMGTCKSGRFELTQSQSGHKKRASKKALDLNGGRNKPKLELATDEIYTIKKLMTEDFVTSIKLFDFVA